MSPFDLEGRRALITGAGGGIGGALARVFSSAGVSVCAADREIALLDKVDCAERLAFDLTDFDATRSAIADYLARGGAPDILVSNAGGTRAESFDAVDETVWARELALNLTGAYNVARPIADAMAARGAGALVFISSVNGLAYYGNPAYSVAKAGLISLGKALAVERGPQGVRSNVICPGSIRTPAWDHRFARNPELITRILPHYPMGRLATMDDVANCALFLASDAAAGITGAAIPVDAGLTAGNLRFVNEVIRNR
jgi:NAD(P)-dependent dehydrogenase (short-subunit alcohol dehydrogenase family)